MCKRPSGDNATRTGLVVGSLLSSVLVLVVWITLVILQRWGVVSEFNKYVYPLCIYTYIHVTMYMPAELPQ